MDNQNKTSFVPKKSFTSASRPTDSSIGLGTLVAIIVLAASLILFAGAYGYRYYLMEAINRPCDVGGGDAGCGLRESLARERRELNINKVSRFVALDAKMKAAQGVISRHITMVPVFDLLEQSTLHNVQFTEFDFNRDGEMNLSGIARSYEDIAVQLKALQASGYIQGASFSGFSTDEAGNVQFDLSLSINPDILKYKTNQS